MTMVADRLDQYWAEELGCSPACLTQAGVTVCAPPHRADPRWMGWVVPLEVIATDRASGGVISVTPNLADELHAFLDTARYDLLPPLGRGLWPFFRDNFPESPPKVHRILRCAKNDFRPAPAVFPIDQLDPEDLHASWFRLHFDGPIFVARNDKGVIASWAAIKCKSDDVWEMAVVTEPPYRGRGLARGVVSRATRAALDAGKVALYLHEITNTASARVCQSLGYQPYGHELTCETGRIIPKGKR